MGRKLSDDEALARLEAAAVALGDEPGETVRADTALSAARQAVTILMLGLEQAGAEEADAVPGLSPPR